MHVRLVSNPAEFRSVTAPLLLAREARHNLLLGITETLIRHPGFYSEYRLWVVLDGEELRAAALVTAPNQLVLSDITEPAAFEPLITAILADGVSVPGVVGNQPTVDAFVNRWTEATGSNAQLSMAQGVFALAQSKPVPNVPGQPRCGGPQDGGLLRGWYRAFSREVFTGEGPEHDRIAQSVELHVDSDGDTGVWLWERDGGVVSLAAYSGSTPHGARVGPVYTPPQHRGRGYGTAVVAALSAWLLANGRDFCFLYTDLANPTSNAIYRRIGYEQVAESAEYRFSPGE